MIYVLEIKDKFEDWHPCRTLGMTTISFPALKHARESLRKHRAHVRSNALGAAIMRRCKTRYRLVQYGNGRVIG